MALIKVQSPKRHALIDPQDVLAVEYLPNTCILFIHMRGLNTPINLSPIGAEDAEQIMRDIQSPPYGSHHSEVGTGKPSNNSTPTQCDYDIK
jgi:hypothetical protein